MPKIEYFHKIPFYTMAVEFTMTTEELGKALAINPVIKLKVGKARFNPKDKHFMKKMGRETAIKNMTEQDFVFSGMETSFDYREGSRTSQTNLYLTNDKHTIGIRVGTYYKHPRLFYGE